MPSGSRSRRAVVCACSPNRNGRPLTNSCEKTCAVREVKSVFLRVGQKIRFFCKNSVRRQSAQIFQGQIA
jgi:hypothetical protein